MEYLTVNEYADLKGCSERYIRQKIMDKEISAIEISGPVGRGGKSYQIPLAALEPRYIRKWKHQREQHEDKTDLAVTEETDIERRTLEQLTSEERLEIAAWKDILKEWQEYRNNAPKKAKAQADIEFLNYVSVEYPDMKFSQRILYRKKEAQEKEGDIGLLDKRGKHGNHKKTLPDPVFDIFEYYYLDESRKTVTKCMELTELEIKKNREDLQHLLPLPSLSTFSRAVESRIPVPALKYYRFGEKAFLDECAPYIRRKYGDLASNDIWVCDNHTFDVLVNDGKAEKPVRVYLTGFLDVRSRKMVGWYVTDNPCSDATLAALRRGIENFGIPKLIYSDNGREFLTHDIGGRGFRKSSAENEPPTILQLLDIEFRTAMVKNAKAKIIERSFRDVKESFSRLFDGYTGGTIAERPERLKKTGKQASNFTCLEDFKGFVDEYIQGIFNKKSSKGEGMEGKSPDEIYAKYLYEQRVATPEELNLLMLRNSRMVTLQRNGVKLVLYGEEYWFRSDELAWNHLGEKVYFRYNPDDLHEVRVYNEDDQFLGTAQQEGALSYFAANKEEARERIRETRKLEKQVKAYKKLKGIQAEEELSLIMDKAAAQMKDEVKIDPKVIRPIRSTEESADEGIYSKVVGSNDQPIDWTAALERLRKAKEE